MTTSTPTMTPNVEWGVRDVTCLTVALAIHALLLLWKGGVFIMPTEDKPENVLVSVNFMAEVPSYEAPAAAAPKQSLFSKMKSLINGENHAIKPKADVFVQKPAAPKPDALEISKGENKEVALVATPSVIKQTQPKLKENTFKIATRDVPFKIATTKDQDVLVNVNAIPMQVGPKTTLSSKSFESVKLPALQSKTFAGKSGSGGAALAMGAAASQTPALNSALSGSNSSAGTSGGSPRGTGKEWTSRQAFGTPMSSLDRRTVTDFDSPVGGSASKGTGAKNSNFNITGALAKRPIVQKIFPSYEMDARVALRFRVDFSGKVLDGILVEISSGSPTFDQKVVAALKEWSFSRLPTDRTNEIQEGVVTFVFKGV